MSGIGINGQAKGGHIDEERTAQQSQKTNTDKPIPIIQEQKQTESNDKKSISKSSAELSLENFDQVVAKEYSDMIKNDCNCNIDKRSFFLARFNELISKMDDNEKSKKFDDVLAKFQSKPYLILAYIRSFKDKNLATECADKTDIISVEFQKDAESREKIVSFMSKEKIIEYLDKYNKAFKKYYEENKEIVDRVLNKISKGQALEGDEIKTKNDLQQYSELAAVLQTGIVENTNLSEDEKKDAQKKLDEIIKQYPTTFYNLYTQSLAEFVSNYQDSLSIDKEKLTEILDKATDNKYSEAVQKLSEKTAVDSETGMLKNKPEEVVASSEEKIEAIKQEIEVNTPKESTLPQVELVSETPNQNYIISPIFQAFSSISSFKELKDKITGKTKIKNNAEEQSIIDNYKLQDTATQGNLLQRATGKLRKKLREATSTSAFEHLFAIGWKDKSVSATKEDKEIIEKRKKEAA